MRRSERAYQLLSWASEAKITRDTNRAVMLFEKAAQLYHEIGDEDLERGCRAQALETMQQGETR